MTYSVKELFFTLQGEGARAGRAAVFLRFTGCNLWSGLEAHRDRGLGSCSRWCDTDFVGVDGNGGGKFETAQALASAVRSAWPAQASGRPYVVCTGGEPLLQLDSELTQALHEKGFEIAVETNGTQPLPPGVDWVCVSPKAGQRLALESGHELKFVFPQTDARPADFEGLAFDFFFLQPRDGPDRESNTKDAVNHCLNNPQWRLSLQLHKMLGIS